MAVQSDIVILGASFEGLCLAKSFSKLGLSVAVYETTDRAGDSWFATETPAGQLSKGFAHWTAENSTKVAIRFLEETLGKTFETTEQSLPPKTFQKNQFQEFVGFGEFAPKYADEISHYLKYDLLTAIPSVSSLITELLKDPDFTVHYNCTPTAFIFEEQSIVGMDLEDGRRVTGKYFFYCDHARNLLTLLPTEEYTQRELQKIHRTELWSSVGLDVLHSAEVTKEENLFILVGTTKDSHPCIGKFNTPIEKDGVMIQSSHWFSVYDKELGDDETVANVLREMKRQIRRAFPEALTAPLFEKITLHEDHLGKLPLKVDAQGRWPGTSNFWMVNSHVNQGHSVIGALCQAALAHSALINLIQPKANSSEEVAPVNTEC